MLIKVYKNIDSNEEFINIKDIKKYFLEFDAKEHTYNLLVKTYESDIFTISYIINRDCYKYIMKKIARAIKDGDALIDAEDLQWEFENSTFYNYCNRIFDTFNEKKQDILEKVMTQIEDFRETDNFYVYYIAAKILNEEELKIFNKIKAKYKKEIELLDVDLKEYLR